MVAKDRAATREPTCKVLRAGPEFTGKQGLSYAPGISAQSAGSRALHLQILTMPPGARGKAHRHEAHETAIYVLSGHSAMWYGDALEQHMQAGAGDFVYIPASMPHLPYNASATETCVALISRTDANEQESVVLMPELEALHG